MALSSSRVETLPRARVAEPRPNKPSSPAWLWLMAPALVLIVGFFLTPMIWLVRLSLFSRPGSDAVGGSRFYDPSSFTFDHYVTLFTDHFYGQLLATTFWQAVIVTVVVMALSYACAMLIHACAPRAKTAAVLAVMLPKMTNLLVLCYGILVLFSNSGLINGPLLQLGIIREPLPMFANLFAVVVAEIIIIAPYPILILVGLFGGVDPALERAAQGMGARPLHAFLTTTFRLTLPGGLAGALVTFIWAFGAYIGPVVLGGPRNYTIAVQVFTETFDNGNWPLGAALAVLNLLVIGAVLISGVLAQRWVMRYRSAGFSRLETVTEFAVPAQEANRLKPPFQDESPGSARTWQAARLKPRPPDQSADAPDVVARAIVRVLGLMALLLLLLPLAVSLLVAFTPEETIGLPVLNALSLRWFEAFFGDAIWREGGANSLVVAGLTMLIAVSAGTGTAVAFERFHVPFANALNLVLLLPLFVPPIVLGMQSLAWHQRIGLWGQPLSIAVAHALVAMPVVVLVMRGALRQLDPALEQAAQGMGAPPAQAFMQVTLPLIGPSLFVAAFFALIISVNEFVMAQFLATPRTQTLSTLIWPQLRYNLTPLVAAASSVLLGVTVAALALASRLVNVRRLL